MKPILTILFVIVSLQQNFGQQFIPQSLCYLPVGKIKKDTIKGETKDTLKIDTMSVSQENVQKGTGDLPFRAGIIGLGSLSSEELKNANTAVRLSIFAKPYLRGTLYFSFNKNALTNDSLLAQSILFPESGNSAFLFTWDGWYHQFKDDAADNSFHYFTPFYEFSWQNTQKTVSDTLRHFSALNSTIGYKYSWYLKPNNISVDEQTENNDVGLNMSVFINYLNVLNKDYPDFVAIFGDDLEKKDKVDVNEDLTSLNSDLWYMGLKVEFSIRTFSIYSSVRFPLQNDLSIPIREFKGGSLVIGSTISGLLTKLK